MKIGLALGGGGVKGIAHIGVLKYLEEKNIRLECISGCSSGSIIALLYGIGYSSKEIYGLIKKYINLFKKNKININIFNLIGNKNIMGLNNGNVIENVIYKCINERGIKDISEVGIPIYIPAININTGRTIYYTNVKRYKRGMYDNTIEYIYGGNIHEIVRASCSYPGIFTPKKIGNNLLVDGGLRDNVPIIPLREYGCNNLLAVMFNNNKMDYIENIFDVIIQSFEILSYDNSYEEIKKADNVLEIELKNVKLLDYSKIDYIYEEGYKQAREKLKGKI